MPNARTTKIGSAKAAIRFIDSSSQIPWRQMGYSPFDPVIADIGLDAAMEKILHLLNKKNCEVVEY